MKGPEERGAEPVAAVPPPVQQGPAEGAPLPPLPPEGEEVVLPQGELNLDGLVPPPLVKLHQRLSELLKLHLKHYHMSAAQFRRRTSELYLPESVYRLYDGVVKDCEICQKTKPAPPRSRFPAWKNRQEFIKKLDGSRLLIVRAPTGSGKTTIYPALAAKAIPRRFGRICCTQVRRATTQGVCTGTKRMWQISPEKKVVGFQHGLEKSSEWDASATRVLFLTEGIIMRQAMKTPDMNSHYGVIDGCAVLMLDEVHSGSSDMELILARVLPRLKNITNFEVVLLSATLNKDEFLQRAKDAGLEERYIQVMDSEERHQGLTNLCLPPMTPSLRDNIEMAVRTIITFHHKYPQEYPSPRVPSSPSVTGGTILVFVPGKPEITEIVELLKNNMRRGFTAKLYPYGFHSDTPAQDRDFLFNGTMDPNESRRNELKSLANGGAYERYIQQDPDSKKFGAASRVEPSGLTARTVIVATNAAETAVTFHKCWLCIDTCMVNQMMYDATLRAKVQQTVPCSQAASMQRGGRAGRDSAGVCVCVW